jgi:ferredoxin--NADP+ reductase
MSDTTNCSLGTDSQSLKVAVIGSGPSGFYAAEALLQSRLAVEVDIIERLPVPYGLVRFGVAPDHAKLKSVTAVFNGIARDSRVRYFGNVTLGTEVSIKQLTDMYHAVVIATGASADQHLNVEGEGLEGVHAARDFVGWYNGHPECAGFEFDLSQDVATVVGQGNVAIDVCRILSKSVDELQATDIAEHALNALADSRLREIHLVGRRGPIQAKFTPKELRELGTLRDWQPIVDPAHLKLNAASEKELGDHTVINAKKNFEILKSFAETPRDSRRPLYLDFFQAPVSLGGDHRLRSITLEHQRLEGEALGQVARGTGARVVRPTGLLFRSVGYRGTAMVGVPFDERRGVIPNKDGRVLDEAGNPLARLYTAGWIKRGPTGIIGTNRACSVDTIANLIRDLPTLEAKRPGRAALSEHLNQQRHRIISFADWLHIEKLEMDRGKARQKIAEKMTSVEEMLAAAEMPEKAAA